MRINCKKPAFCISGLTFLILLLFLSTEARSQALSVKSKGMPAYPFPVALHQPDGTQLVLSGRGNGMIHWYETEKNFTVLKNKSGFYVYANQSETGELYPTELRVENGDAIAEAAGLPKGAGFSKRQIEILREEYFSTAAVKANPTPFPATGSNSVLVLTVDFPDRQHVRTAADIDELMNLPGFRGIGSFRDYYLDMSFSQLELNANVIDWVTASQNMSYYGGNDEFGYDLRPQELVREVVEQAEAAGVDFSPYDNDGDGYIDDLIIFYAGFGEQYPDTGDSCIWSHAYHLGDLAVEYDGVMIDNYMLCNELYGNSGEELSTIGTVVHEFAHSLAIPDMNDEDYEESGGYAFDLNFWDLMAVGSWNNDGNTPAGINSWLKEYIGWMSIPEIDETGAYSLQSAISYQEAYRLKTPVFNEYFILENRQLEGFDAYLPGSGMLIYRVDLNYPGWIEGNVNVDPAHQGFDLLEADDIRDTLTLDGDAFPGTANVTSFDESTTPSSNTWNGQASNVSIQNIALNNGVITFDILGTNYDELPPDWDADPLTFTAWAQVTAQVIIGTDTMNGGYLSAFVNDECRGVAPATFDAGTGRYVFDLYMYSNTQGGEELSFKYYDPVADSVYSLYELLAFVPEQVSGTVEDPFMVHAPVHYLRTFTQGWNWFSLNTELPDMTPGAILPACSSAGDYIKNQTRSTTYYAGYGWFGTISELNNSDLYFIKAANACGIDFSGRAVDPKAQSRALVTGWNWVSYTPQVSMSPAEALASLSPVNLDYIKSQTRSTTYYAGFGWFGTLTQMNPGEGYMMRLSHVDTLSYPISPGAGKKSAETGENFSSTRINPGLYEFNGSLTAAIRINGLPAGEAGDILYAWSGGECRGAAEGLYFEPASSVVFPVMLFSNLAEEENLSFTLYRKSEGKEFSCIGSLTFEKDMVVADAFEPFELELGEQVKSTQTAGLNASGVTVWPNPSSDFVHISYNLEQESYLSIEIYDLYGKLVDILAKDTFASGNYTLDWHLPDQATGAYLLKLKDGNTVYTKYIIHID